MLFGSSTILALTLVVAHPAAVAAQLTSGDISRVVRITSTIIDATGIGRSRSTGRRGPDRTGAGTGPVLAGRTVSSEVARRTVATGGEYVGVPYVWGGITPRGFDCSGFVQYVYRDNGVDLPRTSRQMSHAGVGLPADVRLLRQGDLMLFSGRNGTINHVALYAGGNQILHSSSSGNGVGYDDLGSRRGAYFGSHFVAARRVTEHGHSLVESLALLYREYPFDHFDLPDHAPAIGKR
ncbi:MAG: C40 family peptidase [Gemmatimonadaceae bacterium]